MSKWIYTPELKAEVVAKLLNTDISINELAKEYHIDKSNIQKWRDLYLHNGTEGFYLRNGCYDGDFKVAVVEYMHNTGTSLRKTAAIFGIPAYTSVGTWDRIYREKGKEALYSDARGRKSRSPVNTNKPKYKQKPTRKKDELLANAELMAENQRLRMENEYLKKLNALIQDRENSKKPIK